MQNIPNLNLIKLTLNRLNMHFAPNDSSKLKAYSRQPNITRQTRPDIYKFSQRLAPLANSLPLTCRAFLSNFLTRLDNDRFKHEYKFDLKQTKGKGFHKKKHEYPLSQPEFMVMTEGCSTNYNAGEVVELLLFVC